MLANDSATVAIEVPIWLRENDITALERQYGVQVVPRPGAEDLQLRAGEALREALEEGQVDRR
jgi:hypothetical protein